MRFSLVEPGHSSHLECAEIRTVHSMRHPTDSRFTETRSHVRQSEIGDDTQSVRRQKPVPCKRLKALRQDSLRLAIRVRDGAGLRSRLGQDTAAATAPLVVVFLEVVDGHLDLRAEVGAEESGLVDDVAAFGAVPAHSVEDAGGATLLEDEADGVGEADGIVRCVAGEQEHVALADDDVAEFAVVDDLERHGALVLVEPLGGRVDVVVGAGVGPAYDLFARRTPGTRGG